MRTIIPERGFTAYPNGRRRHFAAGEPTDVSNDLAKILEAKPGLVLIDPEANEGGGGDPSAKESEASDAASVEDPEPAA